MLFSATKFVVVCYTSSRKLIQLGTSFHPHFSDKDSEAQCG